MHQVLAESVLQGSENQKTASVNCPAGETAVGGGGLIASQNGISDPLVMRSVYPNGRPPNGFSAVAYETTATAATWVVQAYAICANTTP